MPGQSCHTICKCGLTTPILWSPTFVIVKIQRPDRIKPDFHKPSVARGDRKKVYSTSPGHVTQRPKDPRVDAAAGQDVSCRDKGGDNEGINNDANEDISGTAGRHQAFVQQTRCNGPAS